MAVMVFYDKSCGLCRQSKQQLENWDPNGLITWRAIQDPDILTDYPFLKERNVQKAMHLLEQETYLYTGFAAVKRIMQLLPAGKWIRPLFYLPGSDWAGDKIYKAVAKNRHKFSKNTCETDSCGIVSK
ncbi:thiol-disulfide oxidoreductase DCC family protein [Salibacterium aidingense]|uniref:thiol-disulfide oxidoreductase DCC family protein n=1 Tax=Salibacterium aidingense TaxID=384933 RepID=UPI0004179D0C|nr:DUF393 domain-containing protein [Salibacterium aidingense]